MEGILTHSAAAAVGALTLFFLNKVWEHWKRRANPIYKVPDRLRELIKSHQLVETAILDHVPDSWSWTHDTIKNDDSILQALNRERIEWLANHFGIRKQWLNGADDQIYDCVWGYKQLDHLIGQLLDNNMLGPHMKMTALVDASNDIDNEFSSNASVVLVFSVPMDPQMDQSPLRHTVCSEQWIWDHRPARIEVKAIARWLFQTFTIFTPIVPVRSDILRSIREGKMFPGDHVPNGTGGFRHLEDYTLSNSESKIAKAPEEAAAVALYVRAQLATVSLSVETRPCETLLGSRL